MREAHLFFFGEFAMPIILIGKFTPISRPSSLSLNVKIRIYFVWKFITPIYLEKGKQYEVHLLRMKKITTNVVWWNRMSTCHSI
jgi:hypothetical protein